MYRDSVISVLLAVSAMLFAPPNTYGQAQLAANPPPKIAVGVYASEGFSQAEYQDFLSAVKKSAEESGQEGEILILQEPLTSQASENWLHYSAENGADKVIAVWPTSRDDGVRASLSVYDLHAQQTPGGTLKVSSKGTVVDSVPASHGTLATVAAAPTANWLLAFLRRSVQVDLAVKTTPGDVELQLDEERLGFTSKEGIWRDKFFRQPGRYKLFALKSGYRTQEETIEVKDQPTNPIAKEFKLRKAK